MSFSFPLICFSPVSRPSRGWPVTHEPHATSMECVRLLLPERIYQMAAAGLCQTRQRWLIVMPVVGKKCQAGVAVADVIWLPWKWVNLPSHSREEDRAHIVTSHRWPSVVWTDEAVLLCMLYSQEGWSMRFLVQCTSSLKALWHCMCRTEIEINDIWERKKKKENLWIFFFFFFASEKLCKAQNTDFRCLIAEEKKEMHIFGWSRGFLLYLDISFLTQGIFLFVLWGWSDRDNCTGEESCLNSLWKLIDCSHS